MSDKAMEEMHRVLAMSDEERERYFASLPPDGTSTLLVADLEAKPQSAERDKLIEDAKSYWYDDFKSLNPTACPKISLVNDLVKAGYRDLAQQAIDGKYD